MHDKILSQIISMKLVSLRYNFKDNRLIVKQNSSVHMIYVSHDLFEIIFLAENIMTSPVLNC